MVFCFCLGGLPHDDPTPDPKTTQVHPDWEAPASSEPTATAIVQSVTSTEYPAAAGTKSEASYGAETQEAIAAVAGEPTQAEQAPEAAAVQEGTGTELATAAPEPPESHEAAAQEAPSPLPEEPAQADHVTDAASAASDSGPLLARVHPELAASQEAVSAASPGAVSEELALAEHVSVAGRTASDPSQAPAPQPTPPVPEPAPPAPQPVPSSPQSVPPATQATASVATEGDAAALHGASAGPAEPATPAPQPPPSAPQAPASVATDEPAAVLHSVAPALAYPAPQAPASGAAEGAAAALHSASAAPESTEPRAAPEPAPPAPQAPASADALRSASVALDSKTPPAPKATASAATAGAVGVLHSASVASESKPRAADSQSKLAAPQAAPLAATAGAAAALRSVSVAPGSKPSAVSELVLPTLRTTAVASAAGATATVDSESVAPESKPRAAPQAAVVAASYWAAAREHGQAEPAPRAAVAYGLSARATGLASLPRAWLRQVARSPLLGPTAHKALASTCKSMRALWLPHWADMDESPSICASDAARTGATHQRPARVLHLRVPLSDAALHAVHDTLAQTASQSHPAYHILIEVRPGPKLYQSSQVSQWAHEVMYGAWQRARRKPLLNVASLELKGAEVKGVIPVWLPSLCPHMTSVTLTACDFTHPPASVRTLAKEGHLSMPYLTHLNLHDAPDVAFGTSAARVPWQLQLGGLSALHSLSLTTLPSRFLGCLATALPQTQITHLTLTHAAELPWYLTAWFPALTHLNTPNLTVTDKDLKTLLGLPALSHVTCGGLRLQQDHTDRVCGWSQVTLVLGNGVLDVGSLVRAPLSRVGRVEVVVCGDTCANVPPEAVPTTHAWVALRSRVTVRFTPKHTNDATDAPNSSSAVHTNEPTTTTTSGVQTGKFFIDNSTVQAPAACIATCLPLLSGHTGGSYTLVLSHVQPVTAGVVQALRGLHATWVDVPRCLSLCSWDDAECAAQKGNGDVGVRPAKLRCVQFKDCTFTSDALTMILPNLPPATTTLQLFTTTHTAATDTASNSDASADGTEAPATQAGARVSPLSLSSGNGLANGVVSSVVNGVANGVGVGVAKVVQSVSSLITPRGVLPDTHTDTHKDLFSPVTSPNPATQLLQAAKQHAGCTGAVRGGSKPPSRTPSPALRGTSLPRRASFHSNSSDGGAAGRPGLTRSVSLNQDKSEFRVYNNALADTDESSRAQRGDTYTNNASALARSMSLPLQCAVSASHNPTFTHEHTDTHQDSEAAHSQQPARAPLQPPAPLTVDQLVAIVWPATRPITVQVNALTGAQDNSAENLDAGRYSSDSDSGTETGAEGVCASVDERGQLEEAIESVRERLRYTKAERWVTLQLCSDEEH